MDQMVGVISLTIQVEMTSLALGTLMRSEIKPRLGGPGLTGFDQILSVFLSKLPRFFSW